MSTAEPPPHAGPRDMSPQLSSSSNGLSSPPRSDAESPPSRSITNAALPSSNLLGVAGPDAQPPPPARKKPGRKPKIQVVPDSSTIIAEAPRVRRPRKPRDPNAPPPRPRKKKEPLEDSGVRDLAPAANHDAPHPDQRNFGVPIAAAGATASQNGNNEDIQRPVHSFFTAAPPPPPLQHQQPQHPAQHQQVQQQPQHQMAPRTSGQNYDPIRSNYDPVRETIVSHSYSNSQSSPSHPPPIVNRASASPSIASLVDPPNHSMTSPSLASQSFFNHQQRLSREDGRTSVPPSPTVNRLAPPPLVESTNIQKPPTLAPAQPPTNPEVATQPPPALPSVSKVKSTGNTTTSTPGASPKPTKLKDAKDIYPTPPPLPGQGLGPTDGNELRQPPTVILNVSLNGEVNKYVNFTRLAEEQYGWDALHPRLAAQRDRLARVAAAGAALERNATSRESGDEMSLDSDAEGSNAEMGGMSDARTGTDGGAKKVPKKRKMREDEYDKDDGFVDDSELLWEEQAAAANDGFFVYSGPLVPEAPKPVVELRADGVPKRGRGRGSRGSRGGSRGALAAAAAAGRNGLPLSGPGSRGGSTTRKPRITKADRARMEQEKLEREKMGMASVPGSGGPSGGGVYGAHGMSVMQVGANIGGGGMQQGGMGMGMGIGMGGGGGGGGMVPLASNAALGTTPMVFNQ